MGSIVNIIGPSAVLPEDGFNNYLSDSDMINVPFTDIENRAQILNLAADGGVGFGVNRIMTQSIKKIVNELGPNDEHVFGTSGDKFDQIRFVGNWTSQVGTNGAYIYSGADLTSYVEITFYGTGLNLLALIDSSVRNMVVSIDGGAEGTDIFPDSYSGILNNRNYGPNQIINIASGLTLGLHTVKIRCNTVGATHYVYGFETLNESTQLDVRPSTAYIGGDSIDISQTITDFDSGFTNEFGTSGTRGGHVLAYSDLNGTIHKDIQWTDALPAYLNSTDHTNEEVVRTINFREFGAGRSDDFSTADTGVENLAFTLDDGTTTLVGASCRTQYFGSQQQYLTAQNGTSYFYTLTFVGTGLDVSFFTDAISRSVDFIIDGTNVGIITKTSSSSGIQKICSGLQYGTHTIIFKNNSAVDVTWGVQDFIIYGPKKPELPTNTVELASYNLMADFVVNSSPGGVNGTISQGTLRKVCTKELTYKGNVWLLSTVSTGFAAGFYLYNVTANHSVEYTFFGTGVDTRFVGISSDFTLELDGSTDFSSLTTSASHNGSGSWTPATGNISGQFAAGDIGTVSVSGLPLALHTIKLTRNAGSMYFDTFDIHTPIHTTKQNNPAKQGALEVGSQAILDSRKFSAIEADEVMPNWSRAEAITSSLSTSATTFIPMVDMTTSIVTTGGPLQIDYSGSHYVGGQAVGFIGIAVDGVHYPNSERYCQAGSTYDNCVATSMILDVEPGFHVVTINWRTSANTAHANGKQRTLDVKEIR